MNVQQLTGWAQMVISMTISYALLMKALNSHITVQCVYYLYCDYAVHGLYRDSIHWICVTNDKLSTLHTRKHGIMSRKTSSRTNSHDKKVVRLIKPKTLSFL